MKGRALRIMKKVLVVLLALMMCFDSVSMAEGNEAYINIGDYNDEVVALHRKLADLGYYYIRPESPWSERSKDALRILQENLDWDITGTVDNKE